MCNFQEKVPTLSPAPYINTKTILPQFLPKSQPNPFLNKIKHKNYETIIYTSASSADKLQTPSKHKDLAWRTHASGTIYHGKLTPLPFPRNKETTNRNTIPHSQSGRTTRRRDIQLSPLFPNNQRNHLIASVDKTVLLQVYSTKKV
jgi:hypothetical protein